MRLAEPFALTLHGQVAADWLLIGHQEFIRINEDGLDVVEIEVVQAEHEDAG